MRTRLTIFLIAAAVLLSGSAASATDYDIDFKITNANAYTAVQFKVHYTGAPGEFSGNGTSVSCTANAALNSLTAFNEASPYLHQAFIATSAFTGPIVVSTCVFSGTGGAPTAGQFTITLDDWTASHGTPPSLSISRIALH
jgi:hypothetical protein